MHIHVTLGPRDLGPWPLRLVPHPNPHPRSTAPTGNVRMPRPTRPPVRVWCLPPSPLVCAGCRSTHERRTKHLSLNSHAVTRFAHRAAVYDHLLHRPLRQVPAVKPADENKHVTGRAFKPMLRENGACPSRTRPHLYLPTRRPSTRHGHSNERDVFFFFGKITFHSK